MIDRYDHLARPMPTPTLKDLLDRGVDMAVTHWYFMENRPRELVPGSGVLTDSHLEEYRQAELETAFFGHARHLADGEAEHGSLESLAWSSFAQAGLRRMSRQLGILGMAQSAKMRTFTGVSNQVEIYDEMLESRKVLAGPPIETSDPTEYAVRVAVREIVLDLPRI